MSPYSIALSLFAALLFGAGDFCGGLAARKCGLSRALLRTQVAGALVLLGLASFTSYDRLSLADLPLGCLAGLSAAIGLAALYRGLAEGIVSVVAPVSALFAALVPAMLGAIRGETPPPNALIGAGLCLPAVVILSWGDGGAAGRIRARASLMLGVAAGSLLGAFYAAISRMRPEAGLWPLFAARALSLSAVALWLGFRHRLAQKRPGEEGARVHARGQVGLMPGLAIALAAGILDACGNAAFLAASRTGPLMIVSVVTSLFPALTVLLARVFFGQRIGPRRAAGLALALAGVVLIGLR